MKPTRLPLLAALGLLPAALLLPFCPVLRAADLVVKGANSPYTLASGTLTTDNTYVGQSGTGVFNHTGGTHTVSSNG